MTRSQLFEMCCQHQMSNEDLIFKHNETFDMFFEIVFCKSLRSVSTYLLVSILKSALYCNGQIYSTKYLRLMLFVYFFIYLFIYFWLNRGIMVEKKKKSISVTVVILKSASKWQQMTTFVFHLPCTLLLSGYVRVCLVAETKSQDRDSK